MSHIPVLASASCMDPYEVWICRLLRYIHPILRYPSCFFDGLCLLAEQAVFRSSWGDVIDRTELQDCLLDAVSDIVKGRIPPLLSHFQIRQSDGTIICNKRLEYMH